MTTEEATESPRPRIPTGVDAVRFGPRPWIIPRQGKKVRKGVVLADDSLVGAGRRRVP